VHSLLKFNSEEKFVWFCHPVVFIAQHFTYFANGYPCYMFLLFKNNPVQYRSLWWVKCHEKT